MGKPQKTPEIFPQKLWEKACEYFQWCDDNPIMIVEQSKMPQRLDSSMIKSIKPSMVKSFLNQTIEMPRQRAYSIEGMCRYLNISRETFDNYSKSEGYETYFDISRAIRDIICIF